MKVWAKRMIWYSIVFVSVFLNDVGNFLLDYEIPEDSRSFIAFIWLLILVIPLCMMKDDEIRNDTK